MRAFVRGAKHLARSLGAVWVYHVGKAGHHSQLRNRAKRHQPRTPPVDYSGAVPQLEVWKHHRRSIVRSVDLRTAPRGGNQLNGLHHVQAAGVGNRAGDAPRRQVVIHPAYAGEFLFLSVVVER